MRTIQILTLAVAALGVAIAAGCLPGRPHPLETKAAPDFSAETLDGGAVSLAQHRGQEIVVLDFWAAWCPPCREGLPAVESIAKEFEGQPVAVYAVNQGEDADTVREFLEESGLDLTVLMDEKTSIGALYGVRGIPQTVIIDKDGQVADVHVGYRSGDERGWRKTINELLAAK
jgi:peroxiredoxin